ncbi:hypothetical protein [Catalinimonas niigatensis]|uniref:hypothetical protein n=1 Tax=Catalinimonas niigatensis TaxID=1397264 RepID=UPI002665F632|nr:hypothetical protein [Catalinimonas niigatensis]WPP49928.1 hypothetical protein PZB72_25005 [Catalinimonas niigatensis]
MNKMISQKKIKNTALAAALLLAAGCMPEDDFKDMEVLAPSPSLALPLLNTNLRVSDLVKTEDGGLLEENPDGTYSLFYRQTIQTQSVGSFFPPIPEQQFNESLSLGISAPMFNLSPEPMSYDGKMPLDLGELSLYKIECKQGILNATVNSEYDHEIYVELSFPDILDANQAPLVFNFSFPSWRWGDRISLQSKDLSGYQINIDNEEIDYSMKVTIQGSGEAIDATDQISLDLSMADIDFSYVEGNFSEMIIPIDADTLQIPVLSNAINGDVALNPNLKMDFINSFGVPVSPDFSNIYVKRQSGTIVQLQDEGNSQFFSGDFEFPYLKDRNEMPTMKSQLVDRSNSNLEEAFAELPRGIAYLFGFKLSSSSEDTSFVADNSSIGIDMEVELPLEGAFDIVLEDTIDIDLGSDQEVEELKILIKTENEFPIDTDLQIFFLNDLGEKIYDRNMQPVRLFEESAQLLKAAQIINSTTGETQAVAVDMPISATIDAEKYELIKQAGSILVQTRMQSNNGDEGIVKLYSSYNIRFSLAMQIKSSFNVSN